MVDYRSRRRRFGKQRINIFLVSNLTRYAFFGLIGLVIIMTILFVWYGKDLPTPGKLVNSNLAQSTRIYDRNGILLYSVFQNQNRTYVTLSNIPKYVQEGTIAIEDKNFYNNQGFSITGYLRAIKNIVLLQGISGGSTITQQLVKNVLLSFRTNYSKKNKRANALYPS